MRIISLTHILAPHLLLLSAILHIVSGVNVSVDLVVIVDETDTMNLAIPDVKTKGGLIFDQLSNAVQEGSISDFRVGLLGFGSAESSTYCPLTKNRDLLVNHFSRLQSNGLISAGVAIVNQVATNTITNPTEFSSIEPGYPDKVFPGKLGFCALLVTNQQGRIRFTSLQQNVALLNEQKSVVSSVFYGSAAFGSGYQWLTQGTGGEIIRVSYSELGSMSDAAFITSIKNCIQKLKQNAPVPYYDCGADPSICGSCPPQGKCDCSLQKKASKS
jgi:hypothetical protein